MLYPLSYGGEFHATELENTLGDSTGTLASDCSVTCDSRGRPVRGWATRQPRTGRSGGGVGGAEGGRRQSCLHLVETAGGSGANGPPATGVTHTCIIGAVT